MELVEATFAVRRKDFKLVRECFEKMAKVYPRSRTRVWGNDVRTCDILPCYLYAAGDPDWRTWRPHFLAEDKRNVTSDDLADFLGTMNPRTPECWDFAALPDIPGTEWLAPNTRQESAKGERNTSLEALATTDGEAWLVSPAKWPGQSRSSNRLFVAAVAEPKAGSVELRPTEIPGPKATFPTSRS